MRTRRVAFAGGFVLILGLTVLVAVESFRDGGIESPDRHSAAPTEPDPDDAVPEALPGEPGAGADGGTPPDRRRDRIRGRIVTRDGRPVPGVRVTGVRCDKVKTETRLTAVTDDSGRFEFDVPEEARYRIEVAGTLEGGVPIRLRSSAMTSTAAASRDYTVEPAGVFSGRVLDPEGRPVLDARVEVRGSGRMQGRTVTTKSDGSFRLLLPRHGTVPLKAYLPTTDDVGLPYCPVYVPKIQAGESIDLKLKRGTEIRGRITWWEGGSAAGIPLLVRRTLVSRSMTIRARTDNAGRFRIGGLYPLVTYRIELDGSRWKGETIELLDSKVVKGDATDVALRVTKAIASTGRLFRRDGRPAGRYHFRVIHEESGTKTECRTRQDGTFLIGTPKAGTYTAWAYHYGRGKRKSLKLGTFRGGESGVVLQIPDP